MILRRLYNKAKSFVATNEIKLLRKRAENYNLLISGRKVVSLSEIVIENYFDSNHNKNALLSYIVYPFISDFLPNHSNYQECYAIAEALDELGYNVDIINWDNISFIPIKKYNLVIDNHNNLERLKQHFGEDTIKIFHATNCYWLFQNTEEYKRIFNFFINTGVAVMPSRILSPGNSIHHCNVATTLGNLFTKDTYGIHSTKIINVPITTTVFPRYLQNKNLTKSKRHFLWFNSAGFLLKGLDVVIDAFLETPELQLTVCGDFEREKDFLGSYKTKIDSCENINLKGWINVPSNEFSELVLNCTWIINTSFSEGGGGSTINCMGQGLIPILSKSSSIDISEKVGFYIEENNSESLKSMLKALIKLPEDSLRLYSYNAYSFVNENHRIEHFTKSYKDFLIEITPKND